jgi:glycosyltransferase involved in cell wall biosynthesis
MHNIDNLGPFLFRDSESKLKRVLTVHDIAPVVLPDIHSSIMKFDFKIILPRLIENTDLVITDSYSTKKDLEDHFKVNEGKIDVAHLGVDLSFFYPRQSDEDVMNKYGIKNDYLLYLGNDNPRKNLKNLILGYSKVYRDIEQDLVLVGPINQNNLRAFIKKIDNGNSLSQRVITPGYVDYAHLPLFYSSATTLVFTSLYEGFGFAPLEAMACGAPVIVSNNSSITEVVGEAGLYINNPLNAEEISNNIYALLHDEKLQKRLKSQGPKRAKKFTWENTINKTVKAYEKVC